LPYPRRYTLDASCSTLDRSTRAQMKIAKTFHPRGATPPPNHRPSRGRRRKSGYGRALWHLTSTSLLYSPHRRHRRRWAASACMRQTLAAAPTPGAAARALFMPPRPNLHMSAAATQVRPTAPAKRKATASKHPTAAVGADKPAPKTTSTTGKVAASRHTQYPLWRQQTVGLILLLLRRRRKQHPQILPACTWCPTNYRIGKNLIFLWFF
jgi:hypothetical protein